MSKAEAITPGGEGRFEGYDVMGQAGHWDATTRAVVESRLCQTDDLKFFTKDEEKTVTAIVDLILAQHKEPKVPIVPVIDRRLAEGETDGWRYEDLPEDSDAWRGSLSFLDEDARKVFGSRFHKCSHEQQGELLQGVQDAEEWHGWPGKHVWSLWTRYACAAFYAHPWAWNEIGFGGPAYPRGYKVLHPGWREPFEVEEADARDPVPWAERVDGARQAHEVRFSGKS